MRPFHRRFRQLLTLAAAALLIATVAANWGRTAAREEIGPATSGRRALVVYQPGLGGFPAAVARAYAEGFAAAGWRTELWAAADAPSDLAPYRAVAVLSPTYWWTVSLPVRRFIARAGEWRGRQVVAVVTAAGQGTRSVGVLADLLAARGAVVLDRQIYYTAKPNDEAHYVPGENQAAGVARARSAAESLGLVLSR